MMIMHGPGCLVVLGGRCVGRTHMLDSRPCWAHAHVGLTPMLDLRPCWAQYTGVILASDYVIETRLCHRHPTMSQTYDCVTEIQPCNRHPTTPQKSNYVTETSHIPGSMLEWAHGSGPYELHNFCNRTPWILLRSFQATTHQHDLLATPENPHIR